MIDMPYFMENKGWYYFDYDNKRFMLTDEAPPKAKESYKEFYETLEAYYGRGKN